MHARSMNDEGFERSGQLRGLVQMLRRFERARRQKLFGALRTLNHRRTEAGVSSQVMRETAQREEVGNLFGGSLLS